MKAIQSTGLLLFILLSCAWRPLLAQNIPADRVLEAGELSSFLKEHVRVELGDESMQAPVVLARYFREKFAERFFYGYQTVDNRMALYNQTYGRQSYHHDRAMDHMGKYAGDTQWVLPFNYLNGEPVNAYALRHLARQHKMVDVAFHYFNDNKNPAYIRYFADQQQSLQDAFAAGAYEKIEDGNGVFEAFRSGYRVLNWLWIHNLFLQEDAYADEDQLRTISLLLQHAAHLYERNPRFRPGNHQTRGMSALAMLGILFRDFEDADLWLDRAMQRLGEHLEKEINADGFQFERSVHYHMSDINNYFYVYQLANISGLAVDKAWEEKLRTLFTTLAKIAYPDKSAPVLQDDTDNPWGETNDISGVMTLGYLLFDNPELGFFATDRVDAGMYWFLQQEQLDLLANIEQSQPAYGSLSFPDTHYYIMREGWAPDDKMMIVSAGLDSEKPDHQHGDMLGIQAMAYGHPILPNYQVRYSLTDFELFKNSMVKNVALVDDALQGREWTSNKGGSGFGKFRALPNPHVIAWESNDQFDLFAGSHDGFEHLGVAYQRQVIFVKDDLWIVKDSFQSDSAHTYKQVFQGHFTEEAGPNLLRATFADASGFDILQLKPVDAATADGARGKQWTVLSKENEKHFSFITAIFPYKGYDKRIDESRGHAQVGAWEVNNVDWAVAEDGTTSISQGTAAYFFDVAFLSIDQVEIQSAAATDLYVNRASDGLHIHLIGNAAAQLSVLTGRDAARVNVMLQPGERYVVAGGR